MGCSGSHPTDPVCKTLQGIVVRPWNVLGIDGKGVQAGAEPNNDTVVLACSTLEDLKSPGAPLGQFPGSLGAVCRFAGVADDKQFPNDVVAMIRNEGQAAYKRYGYPSSKHVIHVANIGSALQGNDTGLPSRYGLRVRSMHRIPTSGTLLCLSTGTVTDFTGDAIVNAANEGCVQGAGVDDAINVAGGKALQNARMALPVIVGAKRRDEAPTEVRCPMGEVRVTIGGSLIAPWCIHAVGPNYNVELKLGASPEECDKIVETTYRRVIEAAKEKHLSSIAFCIISGGMFRGRQKLSRILEMGLKGIRDASYAGLQEVHVVAFTSDEENALREACDLVLPNSEESPQAAENAKMAQSAALQQLTGAYSAVFTVATQVEKPMLRLSPISDGVFAADVQSEFPDVTVRAIVQALHQMPHTIVGKVPAFVELCVQDATEAPKYERALRNAPKDL